MYRYRLSVMARLMEAWGLFKIQQTQTGTIRDTMCGAKQMMTNIGAAQCTCECRQTSFRLRSGQRP